jgi:glycosyltransferase involved in cell wall biosynthesis
VTVGVSVILCVRNGEAYLRDALDSVAAQAVSDVETIVVDDGSQDRSAEIAKNHVVRARVVSRPASGQPVSLNAGLELAGKEFVAFLDADDVWPHSRLGDMLRLFANNPGVEIVYGQIVNTNEKLEPTQAPFATRQPTCCLVRRRVFLRVGSFRTDVRYGSAVDWVTRAAAMNVPMAQLESVVLLRRIHTKNAGVRDTSRVRQDLLRVVREHHSRSKDA